MNTTQTLIDKAAKNCSSYSELARRIGTSHAALSEMKHGKREMSPETAALLADIANEDAREAVIRAVMERNKTGPKAQQIREILGKALAAGVAATLLFFYNAEPVGATETIATELTSLYIV
ncbi:MAG: helix-turn-helix domain-containing protein [Comamonas sp.]